MQFWQQLTAREKLFLVLGGILVSIFCAVYFIWLPLHTKNIELETKIEQEASLLQWLNTHAELLKKAKSLRRPTTEKEIFSIIETNFKESAENKNVAITRLAENKINLHLSEISFDELIQKLTQLWMQFNIDVTEIEITSLAKPGMVEANMILVLNK